MRSHGRPLCRMAWPPLQPSSHWAAILVPNCDTLIHVIVQALSCGGGPMMLSTWNRIAPSRRTLPESISAVGVVRRTTSRADLTFPFACAETSGPNWIQLIAPYPLIPGISTAFLISSFNWQMPVSVLADPSQLPVSVGGAESAVSSSGEAEDVASGAGVAAGLGGAGSAADWRAGAAL